MLEASYKKLIRGFDAGKHRMSELKEFVDKVFVDIRARVESEYRHHLTNHFRSISSDVHSGQYTPNHGEIKSRALHTPQLILPKPLDNRWWIHYSIENPCPYNGYTLHIYDNYGQRFTRKITPSTYDPAAPTNFSEAKQTEDSTYQYPLPDCIIDFVKKQGNLTGLNMIGDIFHQIMFVYAI